MSAHAAAALAEASTAQALVFVTDASQELTSAELDFLRQAHQLCSTVICVITKIDLYPAWRRVAELTHGHLVAAGIDGPVLAVSSTLRDLAASSGDDELDHESGYVDLRQVLARTVGDDAARHVAGEARAEVRAVCDQLDAQFSAERAALADPEQARAVVEELNAVRARVQELKSAASRWSRTLGDGIGDLNSDVDHDLRRRFREVLAEATTAIEKSDPMDTWTEMEKWLQARVSHEMLGNFSELRARAMRLSEVVGEHFRSASGDVLQRVAIGDPRSSIAGQEIEHHIDLERFGARKQAMTMLRAAYGGSIMFVMVGTMVGITLGPIIGGLALVMGHKGLRTEKERQRDARQRQAVAAVRQYLDQISFVMTKDSRDTLRDVQRQLRDHYTALAEQLERSNAEALRAATEASNRDAEQRTKRLVDVDAELGRIRALHKRAST